MVVIEQFADFEGIHIKIRAAHFDARKGVRAVGQARQRKHRVPVGRSHGQIEIGLPHAVQRKAHGAPARTPTRDERHVGAAEGERKGVSVGRRGLNVIAVLAEIAVALIGPGAAGKSDGRAGIVVDTLIALGHHIQGDHRVIAIPGVGARQGELHCARALGQRHRVAVGQQTRVAEALAVRRRRQGQRAPARRPEHMNIFLRVIRRAGRGPPAIPGPIGWPRRARIRVGHGSCYRSH